MAASQHADLGRFHVRMGWGCLAVFAAAGLVLESLHGWKADWYLEQASETRRLMFTLGHAHGALLAVVNLVQGALSRGKAGSRADRFGSRLLASGSVLLPAGFLLGGAFAEGGDPGLGVALVPVGAACVIGSAALFWVSSGREGVDAAQPGPSDRDDRTQAGVSRRKRGRRR